MDVPFELWGQRGWPGVDIVGESHFADAIREVFGPEFREDGGELAASAQLIPEPWNRHDASAVGVWVAGRQVGYLSRDDAARYSPVLSTLVDEGLAPQVGARVWAAMRYGDRPGVTGSVRIDLAEPHMVVPANRAPAAAHRMLPVGKATPVTGDLVALVPWLRPEGECWVHVTLHEVADQRVEIRIDGVAVGRLGPEVGAEMLPAVRRLAEGRELPVARALVRGNRLKAEVVVDAARAHELPESWLAASQPPDVTIVAVDAGGAEGGRPFSPGAGRAEAPGSHRGPADGQRIGGGAEGVARRPTPADVGRVKALAQHRGPGNAERSPGGRPAAANAGRPEAPGSHRGPDSGAGHFFPTGAERLTGATEGANGRPGPERPGGRPTPPNAGRVEVSGAYPVTGAQRPVDDAEGLGGRPARTSAGRAGVTGGYPVAVGGDAERLGAHPGAGGAGRAEAGGGYPPGAAAGGADPVGGGAEGAVRRAPGGEPGAVTVQRPAGVAKPVVIPGGGEASPAVTVVLGEPAPVRHGEVPPRPDGIRFAAPPGWPEPPDGWSPPEGWRPDPDWPPAPAGWQWWVPYWA